MDVKKFSGVYPAVITPFDADGEVDVAKLENYINYLSDKVDGLFVGGSYGSGPIMTVAQRKVLAEVTVKTCAGRIPVIMHIGTTNLTDTIELAQHAETVGADAHILPMGQKTTPSPDQVLVARKLNMGKSFRGELGGPDALSKRVGVYVVTLSLPPDMSVPAGYALQGRIENAFRRTALPLPSGGELRCEETTLQEPGTGQDGRYTLSVTVDLHTFYTTQRSKA